MRGSWLFASLALAASPVAAKAPLAWPTGIYSNVHTIGETGDMLGVEARFYLEGGRHMVEFVDCGGWCNETHVAEVTRGDNAFMFPYSETAQGPDGEVSLDYHMVVWPAGGGLSYSVYQGRDNIDPDGKPGRMRRTAKLFGIAVAKSGKE